MFAFILLFSNLFVLFVVVAGESTSVIYTNTGPVQGEILTTVVKSLRYSSFRSIRYAEPPSGYQRFKPPVPVKPWTEIVNATVEANACPQINLITHNYTGFEDCLFINIFTPVTDFDKKEDKGKAVIVYIYGGSYISGNARTALYGADFLIEDDVILATFNYRVGPLGFLNLYHHNATGNAGLKDQVLALQWIKENIEKFGGNSEKITIFGLSAGAVCVDLHTLSERSNGLFRAVISMSGSPFSNWSMHTSEEAINQSFALGSLLGTTTKNKEVLLQTLYKATPYEIAVATSILEGVYATHLQLTPPFRPTVEDVILAKNEAFLTVEPLHKYKTGNFIKVPYITGFTAQETSYFVTRETIKPITNLVNSAIATIENINASLQVTNSVLQDLISTSTNAIKQIPDAALKEYVAKTSYDVFQAGIDLKQRFLDAQSKEPVYYYQVSFNPSKSLHELLYHVISNGTAHADDLAYIFYMPVVELPLDEADPISVTRRRMVRMWTNFAKYGNPTLDGETDPLLKISWPPSGSSGIHLEIAEELSVGPRPVDTLDTYLNLVNA